MGKKASPTRQKLRSVRPAKELREQIAAGIDLRDWEPEGIAKIFEEHAALQDMLRRAQSGLEEDGRQRGEGLMDDIAALLGE